jgi:hypothetical protein
MSAAVMPIRSTFSWASAPVASAVESPSARRAERENVDLDTGDLPVIGPAVSRRARPFCNRRARPEIAAGAANATDFLALLKRLKKRQGILPLI